MKQTIVFDHTIAIRLVSWKRAKGITKRYNDAKMQIFKQNLAWEVKAEEPRLRCSKTARFGFRVRWFLGHANRGDGDNYEKNLLDALKGVVWEDDEQVDEGHWVKDQGAGFTGMHLLIYTIEEDKEL